MSITILFVEDDPESVRPVITTIEKQYSDIKCVVVAFGEAKEGICREQPDIISLDLLVHSPSGDLQVVGNAVFDTIWRERFCPIIVYSAQPDAGVDDRPDHPFIANIKKGRGSPQRFTKAVNQFRPHVEAIREAEASVQKEFAVALREVAPYAFEVFTDPAERDDAILRSGRRRLAALMDDLSRHAPAQLLASWEQYVSPPVSQDVQLGDVLRTKDGSADDPSSFSAVLTPSCDLVATGGRKPKVSNVLVAACCSIKDALSQVGMEVDRASLDRPARRNDFRNRLKKTILTQGYYGTVVPLPALRGRIPTMAVNLRDLRFIAIQDIGTSGKPYLRVASIDSPFRELLSWAYMHTACRPGLPDRDCDSWGDEIINSC